jgi:ABC-type multidrug transport system fused ATPase/permease subunit
MKVFTIFRECLDILSKPDRIKYLCAVLIQAFMGFFDLMGVALVGIVGALGVRGIQSQPPNENIVRILDALNLSQYDLQQQVTILGSIAAFVLVARTLLSMLLTWRVLIFLSAKSAQISSRLLNQILKRGMLEIQKRSTPQTQYILGPGVNSLAIGILGTATSVIADVSLLIIISIGILVINPTIAISSIVLFSLVTAYLYFVLHAKAEDIGRQLSVNSVYSNRLIYELIIGFREIYVKDRTGYYANKVNVTKEEIARFQAINSFMPSISKYALEITVVFGATIISYIQFLVNDASHAVASLAIFLAAGTRIAPALLRLQNGAILIKTNIGMSELTLETIRELESLNVANEANTSIQNSFNHIGFIPSIKLTEVEFSYNRTSKENVKIENLEVLPGSTLAIVGPTGAGKTTLVDIMLGILEPQKGQIVVSDESVRSAISRWPGAMAYVPQNILVTEGSIANNIALAYDEDVVNKQYIHEALQIAQLSDFVGSLPNGIETKLGEGGIGLSGGQRQRLGIARAMYTKPKIIVFDEATSSLDGITENEVTKAISKLRSYATLVIIAHRLSTVANADQVVYIENGRILESGSFEEVRRAIPNFDSQAQLMGL